MIIYNNILPFKGFKAMAIWPFIFVRKGSNFDNYTLLHEKIHFEQQKELWFIGFYLVYIYYWLKVGYDNNPFEKEAYEGQQYSLYLEVRKPFAWRKHTRKKN